MYCAFQITVVALALLPLDTISFLWVQMAPKMVQFFLMDDQKVYKIAVLQLLDELKPINNAMISANRAWEVIINSTPDSNS